ncbi:hypothetical protein M9435_005705 [Picochlorum sp. BPE23]|nr:hypothetical protein M9435_005705 [Picochlorum sp. BPE23]
MGERSSTCGVVQGVLAEAGLEHLREGFRGVDVERFRGLMIQDYEKYGVYDIEDKQALFKVVKDLDTYVDLHVEHGGGDAVQEEKDDEVVATCAVDGGEVVSEEEEEDLDGVDLVDLSVDPSFLLDDDNGGLNTIVNEAGALMDDVRGDELLSSSPDRMGREYQHDVVGAPLLNLSHITDPPRIRVIVRKRPLNDKEAEKGDIDVIQCDSDGAVLTVYEPKTKVDMTKYIETHQFRFDDVFDTDVDNDSLYAQTVRPLIATVFKYGRGTCFAYGQTGSGKTYTMQPLPLRAAVDIFQISRTVPEFQDASLHIACYEIYGGKVFDLLNDRQRLEVREDAKRRVQVVGLKEIHVDTLEDLSKLCDHAACSRSTGSTGANDESSRSHSIMTFSIRVPKEETIAAKNNRKISARYGGESDNVPMKTVGKLSFIDLAGSERGADTYENDKQTRIEGAEINKSLLALKECIRALDMDAGHVPFRGSKLTSVLRDSFIGKNARTVMIANISPSSSSCEHTLNTLRYADRVKEMKKEAKPSARSKPTSPDAVSKLLVKLPAPDVPAVNTAATRGNANSDGSRTARTSRRSSIVPPDDTAPKTSRSRSKSTRKSIAITHGRDDVIPKSSRGRPSMLTTHPVEPTYSDSTPENCSPLDSNVDSGLLYEDDLACAHRQHIENMMAGLRQEMDLLAKTDPTTNSTIGMDEYVEELGNVLIERAAAIASLQQKVSLYKKHLKSLKQ